MDVFLALSRQAFRSLYGYPLESECASLPEEAEDQWKRWARSHRMLGLLHAGLPEAGKSMQTAAYGQAQHSARWTHEAERLTTRLSPVLSKWILIKGPALELQGWPEPGLRSYDDLDFLCARRDFARLIKGMKEAGYAAAFKDPRQTAHRWHFGWGISFHHPDGFLVEVNHRFFPPHYPWPAPLDVRRPQAFMNQPLDSAAVQIPTPEIHLLHASMHAAWHGWSRLAWLVDIAGLMARHPGVHTRADIWTRQCPFAQQVLRTACGVAEAVFGPDLVETPLPPASQAYIRQAIALLNGSARHMNGRELRTYHEQFMTPCEKWLYRFRRFSIPGDGDFHWRLLPTPLRTLYWILRPIRALLCGKRQTP